MANWGWTTFIPQHLSIFQKNSLPPPFILPSHPQHCQNPNASKRVKLKNNSHQEDAYCLIFSNPENSKVANNSHALVGVVLPQLQPLLHHILIRVKVVSIATVGKTSLICCEQQDCWSSWQRTSCRSHKRRRKCMCWPSA